MRRGAITSADVREPTIEFLCEPELSLTISRQRPRAGSQKNAPYPIQYVSAWMSCDMCARFQRSIFVWSIGLV